jgi:hypothetical protein
METCHRGIFEAYVMGNWGWEMWHTYTTFLQSTSVDLDGSARRLVGAGIAECVMLRNGRAYWRSNGANGSGGTEIDAAALGAEGMRPKSEAEAQVIGDEAVAILRFLLPAHWALREYHPDFGLDLALELFDEPRADSKGYITSDALAEHIFFQVKGCEAPQWRYIWL